jgi:uncharacterized protein YyaL (SSP411 family)
MDDSKKANRLIDTNNPYLLQHAYNPVDWYPWGDEALSKARDEDKPMLVSIGYSACHWCHVMERESFEDPEIADIMNKHFICIKVDREERPDIDQIYMAAVNTMGLQGGWPLNVFATSDQKPFYGGTYFPPASWKQILKQIAQAYVRNRDQIDQSAEEFARALSTSYTTQYNLGSKGPVYNAETLIALSEKIATHFDREHGGLERAPKFPNPSVWQFILAAHHYTQDTQLLDQVGLTLDRMAMGGIYDQLGGGFARYSVDERWFAPHFEKMLYDNAQLIALYAQAYKVLKRPLYKDVVYDTVDFMKRELMAPEGTFYAALDADSEGEEGRFYTWTYSEVRNAAADHAEVFCSYYNILPQGNWENNRNILYCSTDVEHFAEEHGLDPHEVSEIIKTVRHRLIEIRDQRVRPGLDNKTLSGWNGMAIHGLVEAYRAFGDDHFLKIAIRTGQYIAQHMVQGDRLFRTVGGASAVPGTLEDYAFVIRGFLALYQSSYEMQWIHLAEKLSLRVLDQHFDADEELFYFTGRDEGRKLLVRKKELFDNVIPSSNSVMAVNLMELGALLYNDEYAGMAANMIARAYDLIEREPRYMSNWSYAFLLRLNPMAEVAITGPKALPYARTLLSHFHPAMIVAAATGSSELPLLRDKQSGDETTIYVCFNKTCKLPVNGVEEALKQIFVES